jgi:hypothetical protein
MNSGSGYAGEQLQDYDEDINWDEVGNPPDKGKYNFELEKADYFQTKAKKHAAKVQLKIVGYDPEMPELEKNLGRIVFCNFNFFAAGAFVVKAFAQAAEIELPPSINRAVLEDWCQTVLGTVVGGELKHRVWNEQTQADIGKWFPKMDVDQQATDDAEAAAENDDDNQDDDPDAEAQDDQEEEEEEEEVEAAPPQRSLREAAAASAKPKTTTNGHANGKTTAHRAPPPAAAKPKATAKKTASARR